MSLPFRPTVSCFVYWIYEDMDRFDFPHDSGYVGVSENPKGRLRQLRYNKRVPSKWTTKLLILFEGERKQCLRRERRLRPRENLGWNIARGGCG